MRATASTEKPRQDLVAVLAACGAGARNPGCKDGPKAFRRYWSRSAHLGTARLVWEPMPEGLCTDGAPFDSVINVNRWLAETTRQLAESGSRFVVIGGDHSCAIGTWSGVSNTMPRPGSLGLIWIDAHTDMHVPETTHSGALNGMPVAALLGYGAPELTTIARGGSAIDPRHLCVIGARSFEPEEIAFGKSHGLRVIDMDELARRGLQDSLAEAHALAAGSPAGYGVSLDLDAFDPSDTPGVGTPEPGGIRASEFLGLWPDLIQGSGCRGVEIVEYNPHRDQKDRTARLMGSLVGAIVRQEKMRWRQPQPPASERFQ